MHQARLHDRDHHSICINWRGNVMLRKTCLLLLVLILIPSISRAEIKVFTHTVNQPFGGSQSPDDARIAAMAKAKREVLEKAGTYLETLTVIKNHEVEKDEILALAAAVLKAEIVSQKNYAKENAFGIVIKAKVEVDTSILDKRVKELLQDRSLLDKYKDNQKREKKLLARIKELEKENQKLKSLPRKVQKQKRETIKNQFKIATQGLTASELYNKAYGLVKDGKYTDPDRAIEYLSKAIRLDSKYAAAYNDRGIAWRDIDNYDRAISDYDKAVKLNPRYAKAYTNRGSLWAHKGNYDRAISDYDKAVELRPRYAAGYFNRGAAWTLKGNYDRAISDYDKAIELNPRDAEAYLGRGAAWTLKGNYGRFCPDAQKACELGNCEHFIWAVKEGYCK